MFQLQQFAFPTTDICAPEVLYLRVHNPQATCLLSKPEIIFRNGGVVTFDTFFNGLSVNVWKTNTSVADVHLRLKGSGRFIVRLGHHRLHQAHRFLSEHIVELDESEDISIHLDAWSELHDGILYAHLTALDDGAITGGGFVTMTPPMRDVKLGIVITHYNRKEYVLPAIERVTSGLLNDPAFRERIEMVVVDNSKNIGRDSSEGLTIIPNENLGGSGGFTRGLMHLQNEGSFTHCLFMDDDASCEIESIRRAYALCAFATVPRLAVAGSLLLDDARKSFLFEKGARVNGGRLQALKPGLRMNLVRDLLKAEEPDQPAEYGGWWLFAFSLDDLRSFPFPFFVKGDDVTFSVMNQFSICTMTGIAAWADAFVIKESPAQLYLVTRSILLMQMFFGKSGSGGSRRFLWRIFFDQLDMLKYSSASAVNLAIADVMQGPGLFAAHHPASRRIRELAQLRPREITENINHLVEGKRTRHPRRLGLASRILRALSFNGALLPSALRRKSVFVQRFGKLKAAAFRHGEVILVHEGSGKGLLVQRNPLRGGRQVVRFLTLFLTFTLRYARLRAEYLKALPYLTSREFWEGAYPEAAKKARS